MSVRFVLSGVALLALTACGGGGNGNVGNGVSHATPFSTVRSETIRLADAIDRDVGGGAAGYVELSELPPLDDVTYDGIVQVIQTGAPIDADGYYSPISLAADFTGGDAAISGTANQFYRSKGDAGNDGLPSSSGTAVAGSLDFDASLDGYTNDTAVSVQGDVDFNGDGTAEGGIDTTITGIFIGPDQSTAEFFLAEGTNIDVTGIAPNVNVFLAAEQQ